MPAPSPRLQCWLIFAGSIFLPLPAAEPGLLFHLSGERGTTADFSAGGTPRPTYERDIARIADGAIGAALECADTQLLAYRAPGNIYAQRGTLAFHWRSRYPVGPTEFPVFRVAYADHSSWDMVWLRIDYNGHGFDAFVTDASLARTRVSATVKPFPAPDIWTHLAFAWDETRGVRFYVNGRLAGHVDTKARYDAALDQFGPHSRIISPYQVQSDYNFMRGGDIDEVRIYDRMLDDQQVAALSKGAAPVLMAALPARSLGDSATRQEWWHRYGWDSRMPPPHHPGPALAVRKVEIHDVFDLQRWWWKATDGIRETTWPGVYNRSRLPGRNDYFQLPDWDCYVESGRTVTFTLPNEPWNHIEISGSAHGTMTLAGGALGSALFSRPQGHEKTVHALAHANRGGELTFTNAEAEEPIGELVVYHVSPGRAPEGTTTLSFAVHDDGVDLTPEAAAGIAPLREFIAGRHPADERATLICLPDDAPTREFPTRSPSLPLRHLLVPNTWDHLSDGLDGIVLELPALNLPPTHGEFVALNLQVKDPLWMLRNLADFTFSVTPGEAMTLWLDLRDRILPAGKPLHLTLAASAGDDRQLTLQGAKLRLVFKPREAARPEHELDRFTQLRDSYAMLVEERPRDPRLDLWNRFKGDLDDLLRVNPGHQLGLEYAAAAVPGTPPPPFVQPEPPAGVPLWAFRQVELLRHVRDFVMWYVEQRQSDFGDLGGGLSDDTDLTNIWPGVALMGVEPDKIAQSLRRVLDACYDNGMFTNGLSTIQTDELHSYEEGINAIAQNLLTDFGSPRQLERAMETSRGIESVTGINPAGHRHFRSSYYGGTRVAVEDPWGWAKPYSHLVLHVPQLLVDYNGNPRAKKYLLEIADGLLAHRRVGADGRGTMPTGIHFATDRDGSFTRGALPWHVFWGAWAWTNEARYLEPIHDGGMRSLMAVNANVLDLLGLRAQWRQEFAAARAEAGDARPAGAVNTFRLSAADHFKWQLDGDKSHLERLYAAQIQSCAQSAYINTEGSLWIDRVGVPISELQRARLGGIALVRNALYPAHTVSWRFSAPATADSVAILMPDATPDAFKVIAYNLETTPVRATLTGWHVEPGIWEITQGVDTNNDDAADGILATRAVRFERSESLDFTFPGRATTVLTFALKTLGKPYWERPDLGIEREDVSIAGNVVTVRVHSLGAVATVPTSVALQDAAGRTIVSGMVPAMEAPLDLMPRTRDIVLRLPAGSSIAGASVVLDPERKLEEITRLNNTVGL
jgi:hypothetical protein